MNNQQFYQEYKDRLLLFEITIYFPNEKMTLSSFMKTNNLKSLLKALSKSERVSPAPFYLLQTSKTQAPSHFQNILRLNQSLSNSVLCGHLHKFSVWSPHHLERLQEIGLKNLESNTILVNPFKSQELIHQALSLSIRDMVINTPEEYQKIQEIKRSHYKFKKANIRYYWEYNNQEEEINTLKTISKDIKGVLFDWRTLSSGSKVDEITRQIIESGCQIQEVICSGNMSDLEKMKSWVNDKSKQGYRKVQKKIEIKDFSDSKDYILAARSKGKGPIGINQTAKQIIAYSKGKAESMMIGIENQEWLLSTISQFPLDVDAFTLQIHQQNQNRGFQINQSPAF